MKVPSRLADAYAEMRALDRAKLIAFYRGHRRLAHAVAAVWLVGLIATMWFVVSIVPDVPDRVALRGIGTMVQATTLLDSKDQHAFTIFKEQRIELPLEKINDSFDLMHRGESIRSVVVF